MSLIDRASAKQSPAPKPSAQPREPVRENLAEWDAAFAPEAGASGKKRKGRLQARPRVGGSEPPQGAAPIAPRQTQAAPAAAPPPRESDIMSRILSKGGGGAATAAAERYDPPPESKGDGRKSREFSFDFKRLKKFGFITPKERRSRISEEFRLIKRRLMQRMSLSATNANRRQRGRDHVIVVTSARPSEGKSFVAMNLALSIVLDEGYNVMLVDGDVARPSISKILGLRNDLPGLTDLLLGEAPSLPDVLLREESYPLSFLAAGAVVPSATDLFSSEGMHALVNDMASRFSDRIIIIDAPPLLASTEPVALAEHAGQIVMVIDAERTSSAAVDSALDLLESDRNVNLVLNKTIVRNRTEQFGSYYEAYNQVAK